MRILVIIFVLATHGQLMADDNWHIRWAAAGDSWEERWTNTLATVDDLPIEQKLDVLGRAVKLGMRTDTNVPNEMQIRFSKDALSKIIAIPGHAEFYGKRVMEYYDIVKQGYAEGKSAGEIVQWHAYTENSIKAFQVLSLIPSAETVRVLGEMLEDDWKYPEYDIPALRESYGETLDCRAMIYLMRLPIANPPTGKLLDASERSENVHLWKQWYAEIKSGRRTFRFVGDDTEYDLRGPVRRSGGMESARTARRNPADALTEKSSPKDSPPQSRFIPYLAGLLFLAAGLFIWIRGKRRKA